MDKTIGRFEVIRLLGRGGMAEVYLADDPQMGRQVAIKLLPQHFLHDPEFQARFEREARVLARLSHPSVVPIFDFGYHNEQPYMVSPHMAGGSLDKRLGKRKLSLQEALGILEPVGAALEAAHKKGIVHRDLKPANILFDEEDRVYVADFGIAKLAEGTASLTGTGIIGTPAYMSPEQFEGSQVDGRSDQYSLAIVLFEMLSGQLPFKASSTANLMRMHLMEPPPSISKFRKDLPSGISEALDRALSKKPGERYANMAALLEALKKTNAGAAAAAPSKTPARKSVKAAPSPTASAKQPRAKTTRYLGERAEPKPRAKPMQFSEEERGPIRAVSPTVYAGVGLAVLLLLWGLTRGERPTATNEGASTTPVAVTERTASPAATNTPGQSQTSTPSSTPGTPVPAGVSLLRTLTLDFGVQDIAFSPDGELLAIAGGNWPNNGTLSIYNTANWRMQHALKGHTNVVNSIAFSPDGQTLASGGMDHIIHIWNPVEGELFFTVDAHTDEINSIVFSPDGDLLVSGSADGTLRIRRASDGGIIQTITENKDWEFNRVRIIAFSPDGQYLASGSHDGTIRFRDPLTGQLSTTVRPGSYVASLAFSPDGSILASNGAGEQVDENRVYIWRMSDGTLLQILPEASNVTSLAISPDGQLLIAGELIPKAGTSPDAKVLIWNTSGWELLQEIPEEAAWISSIGFSPDGKTLAIGIQEYADHGIYGTVQVYQVYYDND